MLAVAPPEDSQAFHPLLPSIYRLTVRSRNDMTKAVLVKFIELAMHAAKFRQEAADRLISRNWRMLFVAGAELEADTSHVAMVLRDLG